MSAAPEHGSARTPLLLRAAIILSVVLATLDLVLVLTTDSAGLRVVGMIAMVLFAAFGLCVWLYRRRA